MQNYTDKVQYISQTLTTGEICEPKTWKFDRLQIDRGHPSYRDANECFSIDNYKYPYLPLYLGKYEMDISNINVNCLRLLIRENNEQSSILLPKEILFAKDFILRNINYHNLFYKMNKDCFIYLTIRTTEKECYYSNSKTWHVDGFQGSRIENHAPEQDIIWSNINPTDFLFQPFFLDGLNPVKHDISEYFEKYSDNNMIYTGVENGVYLLTPYNIHRVSNNEFTSKRVFIRLTFSPVEIEDSTNTPNPMMPDRYKKYSIRKDVRNFLWSYDIDEISNNGFKRN